MKFLIVSYSFAPLNVISAQRVNCLVRYLVDRGHQVEVLTSVKARIDGPVDAWEQFSTLSTLAKIHEVPFLGRKSSSRPPSSSSVAAKSGGARRVLQNARAMGTRLLGALFDYRSVWGARAVHYFWTSLRGGNYDVVFTTSGPVSANVVGACIKKLCPEVQWAADFRDMWSLLHSSKTLPRVRYLEQLLERKLLGSASLVTTVSDQLTRQMANLHAGKRVLTIRNGFDEGEFDKVVPDRGFFATRGHGTKFNISYAGSIYMPHRDPSKLLIALACLREPDVAVHFFGFNLGNVQSLIDRFGLSEICFVHPPQSRERILSIQKASDMNMLLESGDPAAAGVLTGKLFELAALRRPILSIGPQENFESIRILRDTGLLVRWEDADSLQDVVQRSQTVVPNHSFIDTLQRDVQFDVLLAALQQTSSEANAI